VNDHVPVNPVLDRLAAFGPTELPVLSLYLNTQSDQHGRDNFGPFVRKEFRNRLKTYPLRSPERESFERDGRRIEKYLHEELKPSANGLAIFACAGENEFFEALQLDAPIESNNLYIYHQPHLYPLARLYDQYRRYAVLIADTNAARLFVFGLGEQLNEDEIQNTKVSRTSVGGWSQSRYQRHVENYHLHHAKEVVEALERTVHEDKVEKIILAGDEVIVPLLQEQLPSQLVDLVVDVMRLDITTPEHEVFGATLESLRVKDAVDDAERVRRLLDQYRSGGLGVVGVHDTLAALGLGQVDELFLSASLEEIHWDEEEMGATLVPGTPNSDADKSTRRVLMADELVTRAPQTGARINFIEDASLLSAFGGVGATLRFRL
jgi:peptide chain release factor subunit 1